MDEMVTIRPRVSCATILRAAAWLDRNTPRRFVSMTASHADTSMFSTEAFGTMPAFATMTAGGPNACSALATSTILPSAREFGPARWCLLLVGGLLAAADGTGFEALMRHYKLGEDDPALQQL